MKTILFTSTCAAAVVAAAQPAQAQTTTTPPPEQTPQPEAVINQPTAENEEVGAPTPGAAPATEQGGLEEIVITAQRRSENLQKAAIAVTAVTGDTLRTLNVTRPTELTAIVPALQIATAAGPYNLFYLRGVGNFNANAFSDSAIAFNFDGVYLGRPSSATGFFYDLERVEVLKGPQGTLYGRNATGGAINVISKKPDLNGFGAEASIDYGNHDALRLDAMVNLPIHDKAALRIAGIHVRHDGYMDDGTDDQKDWGARASLLVEPSTELKINFVFDYFDQRGSGPGSTPLLAPQGVPNSSTIDVDDRIGFFSEAGQAFYTSQRAGTLGRNFYPFPDGFEPFQKNNWWGISANVEWENQLGTLTVIPAYREGHLDYLGYTPGFQVRQIEDSEQKSVEARFATSNDYPLRAILGAFYYDESASDVEAYASNWNGQFDVGPELATTSTAVFGRLTYAITPEIRINAGARQTWEDKSFEGQRVSLTRLCGLPPIQNCPTAPPLPFGLIPAALTGPGQVIVPAFGPSPYGGFPDVVNNPQLVQTAVVINLDEDRKFKKFTWRVGADWDITPRNLLYVSYETGFKAGGFFFSPEPDRSSFEPEAIKALTLGSKNRFFGNTLQLNAELFHWRYSDQQISHLVTISGVPTFATENVGKATMKGFEVEARWSATSNTTLSFDVQYLNAKYDEFVFLQTNNAGVAVPTLFNGTGCPTTGFASPGNQFIVDCSGLRPANSPKWTVNFGGQQVIPIGAGEVVADARAHYQTKSLIGQEFLPVEYNKAYWQVDGAVTWYAPERRYFVGAYVSNLFDETIKSQAFPTPGTSFYATQLRAPRTYGLRAGVKF